LSENSAARVGRADDAVGDKRLSLQMSFGWAYVVNGCKRMPKGGSAVTLCHQCGLH
jgi:hypothetical protein